MMAEKPDQTGPSGSKASLKTALAVLVLLGLEAALIVGAMTLVGGKPDVAGADDSSLADLDTAEENKIVEILVLDGKLPNAKAGITYVYDTEIYVQVKAKHADLVNNELEQFYNEIKADISAIWRTAEPPHFKEPKLETLTRKVYAMLQERFGADPETGEPILVKCVIVMGTGIRVDG
jgi:hypothetical protein